MIGDDGRAYGDFLRSQCSDVNFYSRFIEAPHRYLQTKDIARLLFYNHIYGLVKDIQGEIHLAGVAEGSTLFSFAHLSEIYDSTNSSRKIVGFDLFSDEQHEYPSITSQDGEYYVDNPMPYCQSYSALSKQIERYNNCIRLKSMTRITTIPGDVIQSYKQYVYDNSPLVALVLLHIETYAAEREVLSVIWERMPRGAVVVSSTLGHHSSPGVLRAVDEVIGLGKIQVLRTDYTSKMCYFIKD